MNLFIQKRSNYRYSLESVSESSVEGWFYSRKSDEPIFLEIRVGTDGGPLLASGLADLPRGDHDGKRCGFKFETKHGVLEKFPANLVICVKGLKVINFHVIPQNPDADLGAKLEARLEALMSIYTSRLEDEVSLLKSRVAELEK